MSESPQVSEDPQQPLTRRARRAAAGDTGFRLNAIPFLILGILVVALTAALLWWFAFRAGPEETTEWTWVEDPADGIHARDVPPEDWEVGWCLSGFDNEEAPADVVSCERNYDVQVLLQQEMEDEITDGDYPGDDIVLNTAHQWCNEEVELSSSALESVSYELQIMLWHPTENTWDQDNDRLISCFLARADGASLQGDFLATDAEEETSAEDSEVDLVEEPNEEEDADSADPDAEGADDEDAAGSDSADDEEADSDED